MGVVKMEYDNTNRGSIWMNDKKETEKHPDFKGSLNVNGEDFWVSAWKRKQGAKPTSPSLTFSIKAKNESVSQVANTSQEPNDSIPF
jgi:hypothetical protein